MAYGIQVYGENSEALFTTNSTGLRLVKTLTIPLFVENQSVRTYSVPEFDDTLGMFTWVGRSIFQSSFSNVKQPTKNFESMHFNNSTKVFTFTQNEALENRPNSSIFELIVNFMHYK